MSNQPVVILKRCILIANIPIVEGGDATYHFKTLVPAVAAGAIIGKGGETIAAIQKDTGARVKMSKSHDFYPGKYSISIFQLHNLRNTYGLERASVATTS